MAFSTSFGNDRVPGAGVTAVLGPTNTGKTHLAIERMLAHSSGLIGLPLRLLAREVYNKIVDRAGVDNVALVTGEEKIKPKAPRFWVSTVEAMPRDLDVSFLAVDEIQIAADLERGHVFTDRILNSRSMIGRIVAPRSSRGRGCRSSNSPATARSRGSRGARRSSRSPPMKSTRSPN
jgi:ATP-dependent RNA helicase SUPV3L1/SUV3